MEIQTAIDRLDQDIQRLKIDFERFFNGGLQTPPEEFRQAVQRQIRELRSTPMPVLVHRFRLNTLEARFNTLSELFNRRLREREEGAVAVASVGRPTPGRYDPYEGIVVGRQPAPEAIEALYSELYESGGRQAETDFRRFQTYLLGQLTEIRQRSGCAEVKFRVATEGGKLKLKAKPVGRMRLPARGGIYGD